MTDLKENLEIILITYNRKEYLKNTFEQIFAEGSSIKDFEITILNNKSTDGTTELIEEYRQKFPNIKHIIHNRNIGGNANIARAFEIATKKYLWILCDDDDYDFTHWEDVEKAIAEDYDAIVVANYCNPKSDIAQLVSQLTFVPAGIYKTENITDTVMVNAEYNISNMFAQLAIVCKIINDKKKIKILDNWIVKMVSHGAEETYIRGLDEDKHPIINNMFWQIGFLNAIQQIKDKKIKTFVIENLIVDNIRFLDIQKIIDSNRVLSNNSLWNIATAYANLSTKRQKFHLLFDHIKCQTSSLSGFCFYRTEKGLNLNLFDKFKFKIWDYSWFSFHGAEKGIYLQCLGKIRTLIWRYSWLNFHKTEKGIYFQFLSKFRCRLWKFNTIVDSNDCEDAEASNPSF